MTDQLFPLQESFFQCCRLPTYEYQNESTCKNNCSLTHFRKKPCSYLSPRLLRRLLSFLLFLFLHLLAVANSWICFWFATSSFSTLLRCYCRPAKRSPRCQFLNKTTLCLAECIHFTSVDGSVPNSLIFCLASFQSIA